MSEKKIESLNKYAERCKTIASAKVYESDGEVAASIKIIKTDRPKYATTGVCSFAVVKKL